VLFVHNTSHLDDEPYPTLLRDKGFNSFPTLCFMEADGNVLGKPLQRTVAGFEKTMALLKERQELAGKPDDDATKARRFMVALGLGELKEQQVRDENGQLKLSPADRAEVELALVDYDFTAIQAKLTKKQLTPAQGDTLVAEMLKQGHIPSESRASGFWTMVLQYAAGVKDVKMAEQAFGELDKRYGKDERYARLQARWQKMLQEAKAK
jgi:hypothetical protein